LGSRSLARGTGTIRSNLYVATDADGMVAAPPSTEKLWRLLAGVGLEERVRALPNGLETAVTAGGDNLSSGERQLLCLARAILPYHEAPAGAASAVLICDEVTSSVDGQSDERVLSTLLGLPITILYICHRLQHVTHFDLVLVLDQGQAVELGPPEEMLARADSTLSAMVSAQQGL
jgi:ABC-type multidrug transport system fused ATPase/permease subunit